MYGILFKNQNDYHNLFFNNTQSFQSAYTMFYSKFYNLYNVCFLENRMNMQFNKYKIFFFTFSY